MSCSINVKCFSFGFRSAFQFLTKYRINQCSKWLLEGKKRLRALDWRLWFVNGDVQCSPDLRVCSLPSQACSSWLLPRFCTVYINHPARRLSCLSTRSEKVTADFQLRGLDFSGTSKAQSILIINGCIWIYSCLFQHVYTVNSRVRNLCCCSRTICTVTW